MRLVNSLVLKSVSFNCLFGSPALKSADILKCTLIDLYCKVQVEVVTLVNCMLSGVAKCCANFSMGPKGCNLLLWVTGTEPMRVAKLAMV